jgi:hypothetical protein
MQNCMQESNHRVQIADITQGQETVSAQQAQGRQTDDMTSLSHYSFGLRGDPDCPAMEAGTRYQPSDMDTDCFGRHGDEKDPTSTPIVFDDKETASKREPPYRRITARPPLSAQVSGQRIQKPTPGRQPGRPRPISFIQESGRGHQLLLDPPLQMGRRIGPLPEQKAKQAAEARKRGVCIRCKLSKRTVSWSILFFSLLRSQSEC